MDNGNKQVRRFGRPCGTYWTRTLACPPSAYGRRLLPFRDQRGVLSKARDGLLRGGFWPALPTARLDRDLGTGNRTGQATSARVLGIWLKVWSHSPCNSIIRRGSAKLRKKKYYSRQAWNFVMHCCWSLRTAEWDEEPEWELADAGVGARSHC